MTDDLINAHRDLEKLMPYLHLPFQSGSNKILKAMNRDHEVGKYIDIIDRVRLARPDIALSTDIIVGFPGETDRDFEDTMDLVRQINYAQAFSFKYSPRPGTTAATMEDQVEASVASERLQVLQELLKKQQLEFNRSLIGRELPILLEKPGRMEGQLVGRSPYLQPTHVIAPENQIGQIVTAKIVDVTRNSLTGELANQPVATERKVLV